MKTILDKYLIKSFCTIFALVVCGITFTVFFVELVEKARKFRGADPIFIAGYFLCQLPTIIFTVTPISVLIAILVFFGILKKSGELVAIKSCGVGSRRISLPIFISAGIITAIMVAANFYFIPLMNSRAVYIKEILIEKKKEIGLFNQNLFWFKEGPERIYNVRKIETENNRLLGVTIYHLGSNGTIKSITKAKEAVFSSDGWVLKNGSKTSLEQRTIPQYELFESRHAILRKKPDEFKGMDKNTERLNYFQLKEYAAMLERDGYNAHLYRVEQYNKLAFPLVSLVITLLAIPIGLSNSNIRSTVTVGIGKGLAVTFSYWLVHSISLSLGNSGLLHPVMAAWNANIIFLAAGIYMFMDMETV